MCATDFDGDVAIVLEFVGGAHGRHSTGTEFAFDRVAVGESCGEAISLMR